MSSQESFDIIMRNITAGLSGDPSKDIPYLRDKCEEYKSHEMGKEIVRACGRLIYEILPQDKKDEINSVLQKDELGIETVLEEINFNVYKKDYNKALKMAEDLVAKIEALNMYSDDQVSEYHCFDEFFEEVLYRYYYKPTKTLRQPSVPINQVYAVYGSILVELQRWNDARVALQKGLRWNPMDFQMKSEYNETLKMEGKMDEFFQETLKAFKIAFKPSYVARCFRNLGYYFVEKKQYSEAVAAYSMSTRFEKDSKQAQSELYYIGQINGGTLPTPSIDEIRSYAEKYGFPMGADQDVLGLAYSYGKHFYDNHESAPARYCLGILFGLTKDEKIKEMIDTIPDK